jgi:hypothetical protein
MVHIYPQHQPGHKVVAQNPAVQNEPNPINGHFLRPQPSWNHAPAASSEQIEHQDHSRYHEQKNTDPHEDIKRFLLRQRSVYANRHVKAPNQTAQEFHRH